MTPSVVPPAPGDTIVARVGCNTGSLSEESGRIQAVNALQYVDIRYGITTMQMWVSVLECHAKTHTVVAASDKQTGHTSIDDIYEAFQNFRTIFVFWFTTQVFFIDVEKGTL